MDKPETREVMESIAAQIKEAMSSDAERTRVDIQGTEMVVTKDGLGGFSLSSMEEPFGITMYPAASSTPEGYPSDLPFVPNEMVTLTKNGSGNSLIWFGPSDVQLLAGEIERVSVLEGWELTEESQILEMGGWHKVYKKGGEERELLIADRIVTFFQNPIENAPAE